MTALPRHLTWRAAMVWLRGYSDAREGKPESFPAQFDAEYEGDYARGYQNGSR
jgi:hypothetical protein